MGLKVSVVCFGAGRGDLSRFFQYYSEPNAQLAHQTAQKVKRRRNSRIEGVHGRTPTPEA